MQKSLEYCHQNPDIAPRFLDIEEFKNDVDTVTVLRELLQPLEQITSLLSDTMMMAGSDAYQAALVYYQAAKGAARQNIPGGESIYNDLSSRFAGGSRKKPAHE